MLGLVFGTNFQLWELLGAGAKRSPHLWFGTQQRAKEATDREGVNLTECNRYSHSSRNGSSSEHSNNCRAGLRGGT